ncbi:hypothetical protein C7S13_5649 [Burkholderia cepacia]|nr:hypothetical protein [Burkholderia cepacia]MDW9249638.1 hypothetical protein [Burkholderia cepacia]QOH39549.1 hypothetical protein C7S14_3425 [Burkholderia cepacia]
MTSKHINFFCVPEADKLLWCSPPVAAREYPEPVCAVQHRVSTDHASPP